MADILPFPARAMAGPSSADVVANFRAGLTKPNPDGGLPNIVMCEAADLAKVLDAHDALLAASQNVIAVNDRVVMAMVECVTEEASLRIAKHGADDFSDALEPMRDAIAGCIHASPATGGEA